MVFLCRERQTLGNVDKKGLSGSCPAQDLRKGTGMKILKKTIISAILVLALVLTSIPAGKAEAAANPKLSFKSRTLFAGGSVVRKTAKEEFVLKVKNKPKKYACNWSVSDPDVVFVEALKYGKCKVKAVSVGTATVKCNFTDKKSGKKYALETKITVKKNAGAIKLTYTGTLEPLSPGKTFKLDAELTDKDGNELISIRPDDVTKTSSDYVTDVIRWSSSNSSVATVSDEGLVTAKAPGQTVFNCYAIQNATGAYSKIKKATAVKTIAITVKEEISSVKQTALNKLEVVFGKDVSKLVTKDNLVITQKNVGINIPIEKVEFSTDGATVYVTTQTTFPDGQTYTVSFGDMSRDFVSSKGAVASMEIFTNEDNLAVVGSETRILFRIKDANGVDITPLSETSNEYYQYLNKIKWEILDTKSQCYFVEKNIIVFLQTNTHATVTAVYRENQTATPITATASFTGVNEASLIKIEAVTVIDAPAVGKDIDFTKPASLAKGDFGRRIVVKARSATGEIIYSNASGSRFTFEPSKKDNAVLFIESDGTITPLNRVGSASVKILFDNTFVMETSVSIKEERKVSDILFTMDGVDMQGTIVLSNVYGVDTADIKVTAYDQYQEKIAFQVPDQINAYCLGINALPIQKALNIDGTITLTVSGFGLGSTKGEIYPIKVEYGTALSRSFTVIVKEPPYNATKTYKLELRGDSDIAIPSASGGLPRIYMTLYEQQGGINSGKIENIYPSSYSVMTDQYFYEVSTPAGYRSFPSDAMFIDYIELCTKDEHNVITKLPIGLCTITVFRKTSTGKIPVATQSVELKDSQELPIVEITRQNTSNYVITSNMSEPAARAVFLDCAKVTWYNPATRSYDILGTNDIEIVPVNSRIQSSSKSLYIGEILCKRMVTVDSITYTLVQKVNVEKIFNSTY